MALTTDRKDTTVMTLYDTETSDVLFWFFMSRTTVADAWFLHDDNLTATFSHFVAKDMS